MYYQAECISRSIVWPVRYSGQQSYRRSVKYAKNVFYALFWQSRRFTLDSLRVLSYNPAINNDILGR